MYYDVRFDDGSLLYGRTLDYIEAHMSDKDIKIKNIVKCPPGGPIGKMGNTKPKIKDTFQPGWQPQLGMYVDSPSKYRRILKEKGLYEMGNEKRYPTRVDDEKPLVDEEFLRVANQKYGHSWDSGDVEQLKDIEKNPEGYLKSIGQDPSKEKKETAMDKEDFKKFKDRVKSE